MCGPARIAWCVLLLAGLSANAQAQFDLEAEPLPEIVAEMISEVGAVIAPCPEGKGPDYDHVCAYFDSSYSSDRVRRNIDLALLLFSSRQIIQPWTEDETGFMLVVAVDENEPSMREIAGMGIEGLMERWNNPRPISKLMIAVLMLRGGYEGRGLLLFAWFREQ